MKTLNKENRYNATNCDDLIRRFSLPHEHTHANKHTENKTKQNKHPQKQYVNKANKSPISQWSSFCRVAVDVQSSKRELKTQNTEKNSRNKTRKWMKIVNKTKQMISCYKY